jgi:hypothetical protein
MMEAVCTSETLVNFNVTTWRYIPENSKLRRWRVFENKVVRRIFGTKRDKK